MKYTENKKCIGDFQSTGLLLKYVLTLIPLWKTRKE